MEESGDPALNSVFWVPEGRLDTAVLGFTHYKQECWLFLKTKFITKKLHASVVEKYFRWHT